MKPAPVAIACVILLCSVLPAAAYVAVTGGYLANDCYRMAKSGVKSEEALATCDAALQTEPLDTHDLAGTYVNRGTVEVSMSLYAKAMDDYNRGIALLPSLADAYIDRAAAFIFEKRYDEALADANHGLDLGPSLPFIGYYNRAVVEQLTGKFQEAYFDYKKALELEPKFAPAAERLKDFVVTPKSAAPPG